MKSFLMRDSRPQAEAGALPALTDISSDHWLPRTPSVSLLNAWDEQSGSALGRTIARAVAPFASSLLLIEIHTGHGPREPIVKKLTIRRIGESTFDDLEILHLARPRIGLAIKTGEGCEIWGEVKGRGSVKTQPVQGWVVPLSERFSTPQTVLVVVQRTDNPLVTNLIRRLSKAKADLEFAETRYEEAVHRTKNHLQLIDSLLHQTAASADAASRSTLQTASLRLSAIAAVQARLTPKSTATEVALDDLLEEVCAQVSRITGLVCEVAVEHLEISAKSALALAELTNELLVNSAKHAFRDPREGHVAVECSASRGVLRLAVVQLGEAFPDAFPATRSDGAGLKIIKALTRQLGAEIVYSHGGPNGAVEVTCPLRRLH